MKLRRDFVTNSSSSSFIVTDVCATEEILNRYFKEINKNNVVEYLLEVSDYYAIDEEVDSIKKFVEFSEKQIDIILLWRANLLTEYERILKLIDDGKSVYFISYLDNNSDIYSNLYYGDLGTVVYRFDD